MTSEYVFAPAVRPSVAVQGREARFPVHRIYCVGQNYASHSREMGADPAREPPFFFGKPADAITQDGTVVRYPSRTANLHHEVELVIALGAGGSDLAVADTLRCVFGYAVGNDLTRRDLQAAAKQAGRPWDTSKGFDHAAVISDIRPVEANDPHPHCGRIWLSVNGAVRQDGDLSQMIWRIPEIISELSRYYLLQPGDLIYSGTPAGVGALQRGDSVVAGIDGVGELRHSIG